MSLDIQAVKISQLASCFNLSFQSDTSQAFWKYSLLLACACLFTPFCWQLLFSKAGWWELAGITGCKYIRPFAHSGLTELLAGTWR